MLLVLLASHSAAAESQKQKQLQREIRQLSTDLNSQKSESDTLQNEITKLEKKLGDISQQNHQTEKKIEETSTRLQDANQKKLKLDEALSIQKAGLAQQLQALYTAGEQSHLRLLLRQDEPSDISRTVHYFEYMNKSRMARIQKINKTLKASDSLRTSIDKDRIALDALNKTQDAQKADIQSTLNARADALQTLNRDIHSKEKQLTKLKQEEGALQAVVDRLASQAEAKARAENTNPKSTSKTSKTADITNKQATSKLAANTGTPVGSRLSPDKPFSTLRGKLAWPVAGKIIHSYNSARNEKQRWRGVVIAASGGSNVKAVAQGRVAFAGWMDGYGHLIIIEHDNNYMSLYGYNRALYKREGETVRANETIAAVGNSSGQNQDALYFEVRQGTSPQNPARWCR
jgi:septal ring factor EnvC (AmiA/AmiB activator)